MKTLFLKSNLLHIRLKEGEYEVSNPRLQVVIDGIETIVHNMVFWKKEVEWPYGVELVFQHKIGNGEWQNTNEYYFIHLASIPGSQRRKLARLLPIARNP